jgi:GDP-4-dehydro-6-deoxy-D-mannose reductase
MSTIVTGAFGFSGRYLTQSLSDEHISVSKSKTNKSVIDSYNNYVVNCDLLNKAAVNNLIKKYQPKSIYHLAGSFTQNFETDYSSNVMTTKNILDAVIEFSPKSRILLIGSAAEYGLLKLEDCPIKENAQLRPCNPYGLSKIYQKFLMDYYINQYSLDIVMARPFNICGKGASPLLFIGNLYKQIALYKSGDISSISLGNIENKRDYIFIEDAIKHYITIMQYGISGEIYNVASGKATLTKDLLKIILAEEDIDLSIIDTNTRPVQANDSSVIFADISKLQRLYDD